MDKISKIKPEKRLIKISRQAAGRNISGKVTVRHQGGRRKRFLRDVDFKRDKKNIPGKVVAIEYDPGRSANLALIHYQDGEKRYILAPDNLKVGEEIVSGDDVEVKIGNCLPLSKIPVGIMVHNIELQKGKGTRLVKSAGAGATIVTQQGELVQVKLPSSEIRLISGKCWATVGQVGNLAHRMEKFGKAGRKRWLGIRPTVRGVAQDPRSHPHGGGEGRSGIGMSSPKTPWGKKAVGKTRKKGKYSDKFIIKRRS